MKKEERKVENKIWQTMVKYFLPEWNDK